MTLISYNTTILYYERNDYVDLSHRLAISYYKTIAAIDEPHKIYLVQHQETKKIYIKKILDVFNIDIYKCLYTKPILGTPKIIDYIEDSAQLIVIEEYISGSSLQDKIEQKDLSVSDILHYMLDLCSILEKLHSQHPAIIHRDIKPSNVIITNYNRVMLLDFNAAKYFSDQSVEDTVLLGTQGYAAPEQYGFGSSSPQTDIYSLGILFKEMLSSIDYTSSNTDSIIHKCTQIKPAERFRNIQQLREELSLLVPAEPRNILPHPLRKYILPGFRTKTPWKMLAASLGYILITYISFSTEFKNTYGARLWVERITMYIIMLFMVFCCFNYLNIQRIIPLCKHKYRLVRYIGIAILNIAVFFSLFFIMYIIEAVFFPV